MARAGGSLKDKLKDAMNDEVEVDFSGASEGGDFAPIEIGDYEMIVEESTAGISKANAPKVVVRFKIVDGEKHAGRVFFRHCPTTGSGSGILRDTARALGVNVDDKAKKFKPSELVNKRCICTVGFQKGSTELQEIKKVKALAGAKKVTGAAKKTTGRSSSLR
jgi:hypothetical protein